MEGPSLFLAANQLKPFIKKTILEVSGNTRIGKERLLNQKVLDIFSWGKHLVMQFDLFALRTHFMLYGTFEASFQGKSITGDYPRKNRMPRLQLTFNEGQISLYSCSLKYIETPDAKSLYNFATDIMSPHWDSKAALEKLLGNPEKMIGDELLNQDIFSGVGNIIRNEVLFLAKVAPMEKIESLPLRKLEEIVKTAQDFSQQFYKWRKRFVLKKHYRIYRKSFCPNCKGKVIRKVTGERRRISFYCPNCQK